MIPEMNYKPLVSIVIPAYNASNYLAEALDSALGQTYPKIEVIVINDGSKDQGATRAVSETYGDRIRYYEKENGGSSSALNEGIRRMNGEWFSWLSHDDLYYPDKIKKQITELNKICNTIEEAEKTVFFSATDLINADGNIIRKARYKSEKKRSDLVEKIGPTGFAAAIIEYLPAGCSCLIHRKVFEEIGFFDEKLRLLNDVDLWWRIAEHGYHICYLPDTLICTRIHKAQVGRQIAYAWNNEEQDYIWGRNYDFIMGFQGTPKWAELMLSFMCSAAGKTRYDDAKRALLVLCRTDGSHAVRYRIKWLYSVFKAKCKQLLKKIYVTFFIGS